jgi:hypothetical protein
MTFLLFFLLGLLNLLEATTPLARMSGVLSKNFASGLQLQSSLSIISRVINALYLPILGYISDTGILTNISKYNLMYYNFIPIIILLFYIIINSYVLKVYVSICHSMIYTGSLFNFINYLKEYNDYHVFSKNYNKFQNSRKLKKFFRFRFLTLISFIPFYISWPVCFILLSNYPEKRGIILGSTSVLNGLNSLSLVLMVDPYLIKLSRYNNVAKIVLLDQVYLRIISSFISLFIIALILYLV